MRENRGKWQLIFIVVLLILLLGALLLLWQARQENRELAETSRLHLADISFSFDAGRMKELTKDESGNIALSVPQGIIDISCTAGAAEPGTVTGGEISEQTAQEIKIGSITAGGEYIVTRAEHPDKAALGDKIPAGTDVDAYLVYSYYSFEYAGMTYLLSYNGILSSCIISSEINENGEEELLFSRQDYSESYEYFMQIAESITLH